MKIRTGVTFTAFITLSISTVFLMGCTDSIVQEAYYSNTGYPDEPVVYREPPPPPVRYYYPVQPYPRVHQNNVHQSIHQHVQQTNIKQSQKTYQTYNYTPPPPTPAVAHDPSRNNAAIAEQAAEAAEIRAAETARLQQRAQQIENDRKLAERLQAEELEKAAARERQAATARQIQQDHEMAKRLQQEENDRAFAERLQAEEYSRAAN